MQQLMHSTNEAYSINISLTQGQRYEMCTAEDGKPCHVSR